MSEQSASTLYAKLARVMAQVDRIPKRGYNSHFKYEYATESDVMDAIRKHLAAEGVAFFAEITNREYSGSKTVLTMRFTFADGETGAKHDFTWCGEADDKQDKGISKAATLATKYFLLKTFMVSTGDPADDPDSQAPVTTDNRASLNIPRSAPHPAADDPFRAVTPRTEPPKPETGEFVATFVERRKASTPGADGNDRYFYTVSDGDGGKANTFTREPFSVAGVQCDTWDLMEVGQASTITPPVKVTYEVKQLGNGRIVNNVVSVKPVGAGETVPF